MLDENVLWHYTDVHGALGIIQSGILRFADAQFMNDRTERTYAPDIAVQVLLDHLKNADEIYGGRSDIQQLLFYLIDHLKTRSFRSRLYLCSLSETPQSISQWQRYGADGHGYCLGFAATNLKRAKGVHLIKMSYSPTRQRSMIEYRLQQLFGPYLLKRQRWSKSGLDEAATWIFDSLEAILLRIKNPQFADEREWRLIAGEAAAKKTLALSFVARGAYPKPFIALRLTPKGSNEAQLPLVRVVFGPKLDQELAQLAMRHTLDDYGYRNVVVEASSLRDTWR